MRGAAGASIRVEGLCVAYGGRTALRDVSGVFAASSMTAVVGPNGSGKSTLLKTMMGLLRPSSGRVVWSGARPREAAYLPQAAEIDRSFPISAQDVVLLGAWRRAGPFRRVDAAGADAAREAIAAVGLTGLEARPIGELSTGQLQRVLFARLIVQDAPAILLDEPFAGVDARTTRDLVAVVRRWRGEGRTVVAVLHDLDQIRAEFPEALLLAREKIAWGPTAEALDPERLRRARVVSDGWDEPGAGGATAA
ncbi:metal ABC transporter ATP-binding protein [Methylocella sp.]|uniref:metal ABC transporter ATP-binding protein n=1 Tax=Methylocella sp. TaxID=1978226 RepID=UPI003784F5F7